MLRSHLVPFTCLSCLALLASCAPKVEVRGFVGRTVELTEIRARLRAAAGGDDIADERIVPRDMCGSRGHLLHEAPLWEVGMGPLRLFGLDFDGEYFLLDAQSGPAPVVTQRRAFQRACGELETLLLARGVEVVSSRTGTDDWVRLGDEDHRWLVQGFYLDATNWSIRQFRMGEGLKVCARRPWGSDESDSHIYECFELPDAAELSSVRFLDVCNCIPSRRKRRAGRWSMK